ncbi:amidase [Brevibacterium sp. ZH18]|uniref:amidase n=1 Tax=Brevibacterium sp. ZH18 TaxID=2927784 RepID=UPI001F60FB23|nr:amidase [Brevibacterium sp. ZH18]MCI4010759.1 amidase [Brevibacterium sp. ZH18]
MKTNAKTHTAASARISTAVNELLESTDAERATRLLSESAAEIDSSFSRPNPLPWLRQDHSDEEAQSSAWIETSHDSPRTGILRKYTSSPVIVEEPSSTALAGIRFTHKDNIGIAGYPLTAGNPSLNGRKSDCTSPLLLAIESASGTIVGANHMAELAMSPTGHNQWLGDGVNPRNGRYLSGGSSSGSAIAVATGVSDVSLGTDTGGSVRLPAAFCGLVGYKPSNGLFSHLGLIHLSESLDTIGLIAPNVDTVRTTANVLFDDADTVSPEARRKLDANQPANECQISHLAVEAASRICNPEVTLTYSTALQALGQNTAFSVDFDDTELSRSSVAIVSVEAARNIGRILDWDWNLLGDQVLSRAIRGTAVSAIEYADAIACRADAQNDFIATVMQGSRFLFTPTSPILAPKAPGNGDMSSQRCRDDYMRASRFTRVINYLGLPAITIPLPEATDSLSPGLQIIGRPFDDLALLDRAQAISQTIR